MSIVRHQGPTCIPTQQPLRHVHMSKASASPTADDQEGVSQGDGDDKHGCLPQPQQQQPHRRDVSFLMYDNQALQQHMQSRTGGALTVSPPSPRDVGLEPPVRPRLSPFSTPTYSVTTRTLEDLQGWRRSAGGRGGGRTRGTLGAADGGSRSRGTGSLVSAASQLATHARCGSSGALEAAALPQNQPPRHRLGTHSRYGSVGLAPPTSPSTAKSSTQRLPAETARDGNASMPVTVGFNEHLPAEAAQRAPVHVNASPITTTTSPITAGAGMERSTQRVCRTQRSNPVGLTASAQAWHWGAAPVAAVAFQQQQQKGRGRQRRAVAASSEGTLGRRRGGNVPAPLFSNVPTTAAMGAAVAAWAHKSALNPSMSVSSPTTKVPLRRTPPTSSTSGRAAVFPSPHATPMSSGGDSLPGAESPAALESSPTQLLSGRGTLTTHTPTTELKRVLSHTEAAPMSLTSKVSGEDAQAPSEATTVEAPFSTCAPAPSASVSAGAAAPATSYDAAPHLGVPHTFATLDPTGTARFRPVTGGTAAEGAEAEDDIVAAAAAGQQHLLATDQRKHSDDSRGDLPRVMSFASGEEGSIYSLVDSRQTSEHACALPASATDENVVEAAAAAGAATAGTARAFTGTEARTTLYRQGVDDAHIRKAPQSLNIGRATAFGGASSQSRAAGDDAASGIPFRSEAAGAHVLGDRRRRVGRGGATGGAVASDSLEEEALLRHGLETGGNAGIGSVNRAAMLKRSLTAPSCVTGMSSATASGGLLGSGTAAAETWPKQQHANNSGVLGVTAALGQRTTSVASNSFWSSSSVNMNAISNNSIAGIAGGVSAINVGAGGLGSLVNSSTLFSGSSFTTVAGASTLRDPFAASVVMQQNRSALIAELKRRRHRLHKQLELLQKEATARNIFALVRASNASQLQYLLQEGLCNVNDRDYNGCTPLHVAAGEGNQAIVRVLLSFGADVVAVDNNGRTPLDCAAANRHSGVARYLLTVIRSKHLIQDGGDGAVTGSGGDDGSPATVRSAKRAADEGSADMSTYPSSSTSPIDHSSTRRRNLDSAGGVLPLGNSPAISLTPCAGTATQIDTSAQYQSASSGSSLMQSPRLPPPLSRQPQQLRHPVSSSLVASTPSPSRPSNLNRYPAKVTASVATMDAESWCDSDVPPHAVGWGIHSALAEAAAACSAPNQASAAADTTAASDPASRSLPQRLASQHGATAMANSAGDYSTLTTHERVASMSTPRWRHNSIPHGSSPQRPVFLSSLDSTAAAHSRGLIAAESNAGAATTAPSSPPFSSRSHESTVPLPITLGINGPATSFGSGSASVGGHLLERHVMSAPTYLAGAMEECGGEGTGQAVMQQPLSRTRSSASLITTAAATAAGAMAGWHDSDEPLADTNAEGIFDAFLGRRGYCSTHRRRMQSESGSSPHGAFASASSDWLRSGSPPILSAGDDKQQRSRNDYNFNATGSFPGEVPSKLYPPPAPTAAAGAATTAAATPATSAAASGGGAQQRQILLRPPRRPDSRSPATEWGGATTTADAVACPMRILHPLQLLGVDSHEELSSYHARTATSVTSSTTAATAASGGGSPRLRHAASSSLCDMGQQSLEEHHHHYRLTAFGALGNQQQLKGKYSCDRHSTRPPLLQAPRAMSNPTKMEAAVAGPASPSGGGGDGGSSSNSSAITKNGNSDVTPLFSVPAVAAPSSSRNTTAGPSETTKTLVAAPAAAPAAAPTAGSHIAEEQPFLQEMHHEPVELAALHHSSYTTISDTVSVIVCMVGLPGRGKSFISKRLVRYMNWKGVPCKVFNAGNYRRQLLGVEATAGADFFNPDNPQGAQLRERMAELACEDLVNFIASHSLAVGILDATNTTRKRRAWLSDYFQKEAQQYAVPYRLLFIESVCTDDTIVTENILRSKCGNDDFRNLRDVNAVISEFRNRILQYEKVYETLEPEERMPYIKIVNVKRHVILHRVPNGLGSRIAFFLLNLHPIAFPIYVALPGETVGDSKHVYGGDERLTAQGEAYALALKHFIQDRYVPHMVVLHATNYCVLSTLAPLMEGATQEEDASALQVSSSANQRSAPAGQQCAAKATLAPADAVATTGGEPSTPNASSEAPQDLQQHDEGVAEEQSMHEDDSDQVDADEEDVGDEVLCAVPGLDNINFGRFSGHTAAWVKEKYPRLSALLYDVDDDDVVGDARAGAAAAGQQHQSRKGSGEADATTSSAPVRSDTAAEWFSAPLPPRVHYATHEEAVSHLQRTLSGADPRLSYCTQLPNGESCRQVNVRLEPALMAVMRTQSPVFVVAPAVPAQGILSFFMDVIPEQSPTIRIPKGCVIEIGVKDGITVHPLLANALPERMTRSPLTVLPEIQNAIREVAAASSMEMCAARTCAEVSASTQAGGCTVVGDGGAAALLSAVAAGGEAGGSVKGDACPVSASAS
ncbi:putative 6-phosphofructo-2-kinase/fructose-2,6-bipho sphatase [Leishmania major strain Friedlin]|uniref:Putative 6-phosphofructo-2-kinase/fructose-2,6-bipho sphatase n=1 Tax=Leishmania major TaxID=5664 RepID=E9ACM5_LEIMA|nr:putative 6-phosphofructo-2-kinase/fructose-2,6-bipho sphatase [Leishmania major strain Friedlin]CAG9567306.1 6-phosphofructo-2-kinase/fructose-2_-6-biphosphatase_-_putative [Leishmania major strain Friedlin]CBZ12042.1 putative 6-phosphofructo-2-kinase/fructose-2,6-bipho sphatase [Leishmania major strain Friedlin]|eukprot:XP_003721756.1 putative 6-phosphofructo-2-kinase/fructose-2,6-bipho sphatase [Leishmania major strain Friedlin]